MSKTDRTDADLDLMLAFDGELDDERASELLRASDAAAGLGELSELVRGHLEQKTDRHEAKLAGLWDQVERRISANGQSAPATRPAPAKDRGPTIGERIVAWFETYRGHFVTGAVSAAAVALIMITLGPGGGEVRTEVRTVTVPAKPTQVAPVNEPQEATPPEVENLEVYSGSGTILTQPGEDGEGDTSIIWLTTEDAEDTMEGPI